MKKLIYLLIVFVLGTNIVIANQITLTAAKGVAENFYTQNSKIIISSITLAFTETTENGVPVYFVFNVNSNDGFVIVSADDAAHAIIGYSTKRQFVIPAERSNISNWLHKRKNEIIFVKINNISASPEIANEWTKYQSNQKALPSSVNTMSIGPLLSTTWNQSPNYNALCPSSSVTGCVATAMAQIMRFWQYPVMGTGSSSYCDCGSPNFTNNYGTLSANYGATTYNWSNMPTNVSSPNSDVATLNYQCGVSVEMDYSPSGSGAQVIGGNPSSQYSYITYFGYDPTTIQGLDKASYTDAQWIALLEGDLNLGRPIQYVGADPSAGGHTWVCDGYDANDHFHMNWGWGGADDGFFGINALTAGGYTFSDYNAALIGIQPLASLPIDAGVAAVNSPTGIFCTGTFSPSVRIKNYGANTLTSCVINYKIDGNSIQTQNWSGSLASGQTVNVTLASMTATAGSHTLTCFTTNPNSGTDGNSANDQSVSSFSVSITGTSLPLVEGFESSVNLPTGWSLNNPDNDAACAISTTVFHTGSHCIGFNNCSGDGSGGLGSAADMTGKKDRFITPSYNLSSGNNALTFDVAYTPSSVQGVVYSDTLVVFSSSDCGAIWNEIYHKGGTLLASAPTFVQT